MGFMGASDRNFWLTQGVAKSLGISLTAALANRQLDAAGYTMIVARCQACPHSRECEGWMSVPAEPADGAPGFCRNKAEFDRLANSGRR